MKAYNENAGARRVITVMAGLALSAAAATASASVPQVSGATATAAPRPAQARLRCVNCSDSVRLHLEGLFRRMEELRGELDRRLTSDERQKLSEELIATLRLIEKDMPPPGASAGFIQRSPGRITVTVQRERRGYIGVNLEGISSEDREAGIVRWFEYPRVISIDPDSPAERAGLVRGDTLLAFNGIDIVNREFVLAKLLVPNDRLNIRVRREGDAKEFRLVVAEAPAYAVRRMAPVPLMDVAQSGGQSSVAVAAPRAVEPPSAAVSVPGRRAPEVSVRTPFTGQVYFFNNPIGGATIEPLSDGLVTLTGASDGVFVVRVTPGSQAERSGLRAGDVIVSTKGGEIIKSTRDLTLALAQSDRADGVLLVIVRERKRQELTFRW